MTTKTGATLTESVLATARGLTAAAALLAMLGLFHWLGAWPRLETWALQWTMMTRHTGVGLLVTTGALALVLWPGPGNARRASLSAALGLTVCAFGAWGVVGWLTHVPAWAAVWTPTGAWSVLPLGPLACALGGLAVWALDRRPGATVPPSDVLALLLGAVGAAPVTGYVVDLAAQPRLVETLGIAPSAGLGWTLCAAALLLARPGRGLAAILVATGPGGGVARRLLPIVAAVPMSLTASHLALDWAGLGGTMLGRTAQVLALMGLAFLLVLWTSYPLEASERALRDSEARLRGLVEAMPDALFVLDATGWITDANPAASTLLGLRREALLGQPLARWVTTDPAPTAPGLFDALAQAGSPDTPSTAHRPDGTSRPVELTLAPIEASGGRLEVAICRDVSERQRTAEALARRTGELAQARALERLRDHVYSSLSHELRTPLTVIRANTEMLQEEWPDDARLRSLQEAVQSLCERIEALLDHAALLAGDMPLYVGLLEVPEVFACLTARHRAHAAASGLTLHVACEAGLPPVLADAHRLTQALTALLDNAVKFTPAGGHLGLRGRQEPGAIVLEVWNTGPGIPPEVLPRLGETFYQAETGDTRSRSGLGLGLAIARMLVALHGGTLKVASPAGGGATFGIWLPLEAPTACAAGGPAR